MALCGLMSIKEHKLPHRGYALDWSKAKSGRPGFGGVYVFWWRGGPRRFYRMLQNHTLHFSGPGRKPLQWRVTPACLKAAENGELPLYVGRNSGDIASRVGLHLKLGTSRTVLASAANRPSQRMTSSCQVRDRLDRLFPEVDDTRELALGNLMLSYARLDAKPGSFAERFFLEHEAIAAFRPIFNIDSER